MFCTDHTSPSWVAGGCPRKVSSLDTPFAIDQAPDGSCSSRYTDRRFTLNAVPSRLWGSSTRGSGFKALSCGDTCRWFRSSFPDLDAPVNSPADIVANDCDRRYRSRASTFIVIVTRRGWHGPFFSSTSAVVGAVLEQG